MQKNAELEEDIRQSKKAEADVRKELLSLKVRGRMLIELSIFYVGDFSIYLPCPLSNCLSCVAIVGSARDVKERSRHFEGRAGKDERVVGVCQLACCGWGESSP